tara:strand:- start:4611 stop:5375 length:765 start_codon:yes stop_codon:yes gene_type:complete
MSWQDEYDQVEDRLAKFWKDNPEGRIETEIISITDDHKSAVHKASVFLNKKDVLPTATGIAQDQHGPKGANQTSWIENGETSAVGRALANYIYQAKKRPSVTEMQKVENLKSDTVKPESLNNQVTKSVDQTSNSKAYTPSPSVQKKLDEVQQAAKVAKNQSVEQNLADTFNTNVQVSTIPKCMTCNNDVWDNRADKASGKVKPTYPDYKCKTKDCRIWYIDSYANDKKAPEEWYMPKVDVKPNDINDIDDDIPF